MGNNGVFITLYDEETLNLYLCKGVYGFLMKPIYDQVSSHSNHYKALADYGCLREGSHVFFFLKRKIVYGGQIIGNISDGSFYINGPYSPLGREANSDVYWDESERERYVKTYKKGIFKIDGEERCQPFIVKFKDDNNLKGKYISSDELYFELGKYPYPLPANAIQNMGFCILTPGETEIAIKLLRNSSNKEVINCDENIELDDNIIIYNNTMGVQSLKYDEILSESYLEFTLLSNSKLLSELIELPDNYTLSRQVPISPFKPSQMDRADICIYDINNPIKDGTLPNIIIELKKDKANYQAIEQVERYLRWIEMIIDDDTIFKGIKAYIVASGFTKGIYEPLNNCKYKDMIKLIDYKEIKYVEDKNLNISVVKNKPFLRWEGMKTRLLSVLEENLPENIKKTKTFDTYVEPFVGSGEFFIYLASNYNFSRIVINDINYKLINTYRVIKSNCSELINKVNEMKNKYLQYDKEQQKEMYLNIRKELNDWNSTDNIKQAANFIFINKTCFYGLYRENRRGQCNVPWGGQRKNTFIFDEEQIESISELLNLKDKYGNDKIIICNTSYEKLNEYIHKDTIVYLDPPYRPITKVGFNDYNKSGFNDDSQIELSRFYKEMDEKGARVMLSNSDPKNLDVNDEFFDVLYSGFNIQRVSANRIINFNWQVRGNITEILVKNYRNS